MEAHNQVYVPCCHLQSKIMFETFQLDCMIPQGCRAVTVVLKLGLPHQYGTVERRDASLSFASWLS